MFLVLVSAAVCERPSGTFAVTFVPPAVEYAEVDNTVHQRLLAGGTGGFERTSRSVHPDVYTRNKAACKLHVVVVKEENLTHELGTLRDVVNLLDESLACTVSGVSLTGKEELNGVVGVVHNLRQAVEV